MSQRLGYPATYLRLTDDFLSFLWSLQIIKTYEMLHRARNHKYAFIDWRLDRMYGG